MGQASFTNNAMFYSVFFWTKLVWSRSQKLQDIGTGAKKLWCLELELEPEIWVLAPMSLVRGGLTGVIIALCRAVLKNGEANMRNSHLLSRNYNRTIMPAKMKANENFSDASVKRFYSVTINHVMSPSNAVDLVCRCNSLFEFQVVHRHAFTVV